MTAPTTAPSTATVERALRDAWGLAEFTVQPHDGGMNSRTWFVSAQPDRWVAKAVPVATQPFFAAGLAVAARVEAAGIPAGAPLVARDGRLAVLVDDHALVLLAFVDGRPLTGSDQMELRLIGRTLARVHRALAGFEVVDTERFHWLDPAAGHLDVAPWVRPAVIDALAAYEAIAPESLTWGLLHSDPAPEAFRLDAAGTCGVIDWDRALIGPLLYDLASAALYVGGPDRGEPLVAAYVANGGLDRSEVDHGLLPLLRLRWAVQADYFARRIATGDLTGIGSPAENDKGLEDARRAFLAEDAAG